MKGLWKDLEVGDMVQANNLWEGCTSPEAFGKAEEGAGGKIISISWDTLGRMVAAVDWSVKRDLHYMDSLMPEVADVGTMVLCIRATGSGGTLEKGQTYLVTGQGSKENYNNAFYGFSGSGAEWHVSRFTTNLAAFEEGALETATPVTEGTPAPLPDFTKGDWAFEVIHEVHYLHLLTSLKELMEVPHWLFQYKQPLTTKWITLREGRGGRSWGCASHPEVPKGTTPVTSKTELSCGFNIGPFFEEEEPTVEILGKTYYQIDVEMVLDTLATVGE